MDNIVTIPKKLIKKKNLILIPRREYEEFSEWRAVIQTFKVFMPTADEKKTLRKAREDYKKGKYITWYELKRKLGFKNQRESI